MAETGFFIHLYGLVVGLGVVAGIWVAARMVRIFTLHPSPFTLSSDAVWDAVWWVFLPAVVGARLYHVVDLWEVYRENIFLIPAVWTGGLGIFGGILGGVLGLGSYCWWRCKGNVRAEVGHFARLLSMVARVWQFSTRGKPGLQPGQSSLRLKMSSPRSHPRRCTFECFLAYLDLAAFGLPVGQAIGRWGNFFNQELYGLPTDLPWGIFISLERRAEGLEQYTRFHPLFLYESLWSILSFCALFLVARRKGGSLAPGSYFAIYLILYGVGRFWLERLRIEPWAIDGLAVASIFSLAFVVVGVVFLYSINRKIS